MKKFIYILFLAFINLNAFAQSPNIQWQRSLGGSFEDVAKCIQQTSEGGYIVAGWTNSNDGDISGGRGDYDHWIVKLNDTGNIEWQRSLGGSFQDEAYAIQQTADGGYIVAGGSASNDGDVSGHRGSLLHPDFWIIKLNDSGDIQWQKSLGGSDLDIATSIQQTFDGGYIVAGRSKSNDYDVSGNHGIDDFWVVKLNDTGAIQWQRSLGGSADEIAYSVKQTLDGGYIIAGNSGSNDGDVSGNHGQGDFWIVKLNDTGGFQWQKCLGGSRGEGANSVSITKDGGYIVAGTTTSADGDVTGFHGGPAGINDFWIVKINDTGSIQWEKALGGTNGDQAQSVRQTEDGGYIIAGASGSNDGDVTVNYGSADCWIVKLDSAGTLIWQKSFGGSKSDFAMDIRQINNGYVFAGQSSSNDSNVSGHHGTSVYPDYWIVKLNCNLNAGIISGSDTVCFGAHITLTDTASGGVWSLSNGHATILSGIVTGVTLGADTAIYSVTNGCGTAFTKFPLTVIMCPSLELNPVTNATQISILPNPTTGNISLTGAGNVNIKVYNIIGQLIKEATNTDNISISEFPSGMYFVRLFNEQGALIKQDKIIKE
jgi:hypothetical protein